MSLLADYVVAERKRQGFKRQVDFVRAKLPFKNETKGIRRLDCLEKTGFPPYPEFFPLVVKALNLDIEKVKQLIAEDRRIAEEKFRAWQEQPSTPICVVRVMSCVYAQRVIPEEIRGNEEAIINFGIALSKEFRGRMVWIEFDRKHTGFINEKSEYIGKMETTLDYPSFSPVAFIGGKGFRFEMESAS